MIESACRIILVTFVFLMWLTPFLPMLAHADGGKHQEKHHQEKPPTIITQTVYVPVEGYKGNASHRIVGYAAVGAALDAYLNRTQHPMLYAFAGTVAISAIQESVIHHKLDARNMAYNALGAAIGSLGMGLYVGPNYIGFERKW